jgi:hypothetical protein
MRLSLRFKVRARNQDHHLVLLSALVFFRRHYQGALVAQQLSKQLRQELELEQ